ncbi:MAG: SusC/RagA family TonB-linked outer membrane protein, partial [Polaribacter sp.]
MKTVIFLFCSLVFSFNSNKGFSQNTKIKIDADKTISVVEIFNLIKKQTDYQFVYDIEMIKNTPTIFVKKGIIKAGDLLHKGLNPSNCTFEFTNNTVIVKKKATPLKTLEDRNTYAQQRIVSGKVLDENKKPLLGASVVI